MQFRLFQYPLPAESGLDDLNAYLRRNRVVRATQKIVSYHETPVLIFVVETTGGAGKADTRQEPDAPKVDYREVFNDAQFLLFSQLRELRKTIAEREGVRFTTSSPMPNWPRW